MTKDELLKIFDLATMQHTDYGYETLRSKVQEIAREALAEHAMQEVQRLGQEIEQEPHSVQQAYAMAQVCLDLHEALGCKWGDNPYLTISQLKTIPPQRKPLTHDELSDIWFKQSTDWMEFARAIEAEHGITGEHNGNV